MRLFGRGRRPEVTVDLPDGFWVAESRAMQRMIVDALTAGERTSTAGVPARLAFSPGEAGRVVVTWRNRIVGFVPADPALRLSRVLAAAPRAAHVAAGEVLVHRGQWRIWAGPPWSEQAGPPPLPADELEPAQPTIFGIPLSGRHRPAPAPSRAEGPDRSLAGRAILAVGSHSWEVRDGAGSDVEVLRRRIAVAQDGETLHARVEEEMVTIRLDGETRVTLTDLGGGTVEVLYPAPGS